MREELLTNRRKEKVSIRIPSRAIELRARMVRWWEGEIMMGEMVAVGW